MVSKLFLITHTFISKKNFEHVPQYICIPIDCIPVLLYYYVLSEAYEENRIWKEEEKSIFLYKLYRSYNRVSSTGVSIEVPYK